MIVVCCLFYTLVAYNVNNIDPDQAAVLGAVLSGFIVFNFVIKLVLSAMNICNRCNKQTFSKQKSISRIRIMCRASDFFQDWWAEVTQGARNGGSFSEMMGQSISN